MSYVIITGASSGLGRDMAFEFARKGINLVLIARRNDLLEQIKKELKDKFPDLDTIILSVDLLNERVENIMGKLQNLPQGKVKYLVNNAGIGWYESFHQSPIQNQERMMDLNMKVLVQWTHFWSNYWVENEIKGAVLNVASISAYFPGPTMAVYYASKSFVHSFSLAINEELKPFKIQVSSLCPGPTLTEFSDNAQLGKSQLFDKQIVMNSKDVAKYAVNKFLKGRIVIIPGFMNKMNALSSRFASGTFAAKIIHWMSKEKN